MPKLVPSHSSPSTVRCLLHAPPAAPAVPRTGHRHRQSFGSTPSCPLAQPRHGILHDPWLSASPTWFSQSDRRGLDGFGSLGDEHKPPDERIIKLGKTLRTLSPLLPNLLINPLPPNIVSPSVSLDLFPSTHPHLPTVRGRTLYRAALWTVPVAWSSVPLVGNVKLQIESERIVRAGMVDPDRSGGGGDERLVVRWKTEPRGDSQSDGTLASAAPGEGRHSSGAPSNHSSLSKVGINRGLSVLLGGEAPIFKLSKEEQFTGLFIFGFDEEGRIATHTIEHADNANGWDRTAKFVTLTDWLIGKARGSLDPTPGLAMQGYPGFDLQRSQGRASRRQ